MFLPKLNVYFWILLALWLAACDPMAAPLATPQTLIITAVPSNTPAVTPTPLPPTNTPAPTDTPAPTATPFPCRTNSGQVVRVDTFPSVVAGGENLRYRVYVPPCYQESGRRYPYLILLHGAASREDQWENLGVTLAADQGFTLGVLPPMIIVLPYWGSIGNDNTFPPAMPLRVSNADFQIKSAENFASANYQTTYTAPDGKTVKAHRVVLLEKKGNEWKITSISEHYYSPK